jgi:hypothetical protein
MSAKVENNRRLWLFLFWLLIIIVLVGFVLAGFISRTIKIQLGNGGSARITPASLWNSCKADSNCKIVYQKISGESGTIALWQDFFDEPVIVMSSSDGKALLCLYDFDVDLRLLRIDPTHSPKPFLPQSRLDTIVCASPCYIEAGTTNDWQEILDYLKNLSPTDFSHQAIPIHDFGIIRFGVGESARQNLLRGIEEQIKIMHQFGATQWPAPNH